MTTPAELPAGPPVADSPIAGTPGGRARRRLGTSDRLDGLLVVLVVVLGTLSAALVLAPPFQAAVVAPALDITLNTFATVVAGGVAAVAWSRFREGRQVAALYQCAAFLALCATNAVMVALVVLGLDGSFGLSLSSPGQAPAYVWTVARLFTAGLLLVGATAGLRRWDPERRPVMALLVIPAALLVGALLMLPASEALLPRVVGPQALIELISARQLPSLLPALSGALVLLQGIVAGVFIVGAVLYLRLYRRDQRVADAFLATGMIVAAFSQLHFAMYPVVYASVVTVADALRVFFYAILLLGVAAEVRADFRALQAANNDLERLREAEVARAALEERARLAREVHDGLAQDLWFAKLKQGRLIQREDLQPEARRLGEEVSDAIDSALAEARQAVMAMRADPTSASSFRDVLARYVDDFADRFGLRGEFAEEGVLPVLRPRTEAELLRIVQEALNNVRKHADATMVRVRVGVGEGALRVQVSDNGRGFEPAAVGRDRFGLQSMRERAQLIGGSLEVDSRPRDGTRITVVVPLGESPANGQRGGDA